MTLPDENDMGGHALATSPCYACQKPFWFVPSRVISIEIDPITGAPPDVDPWTGQPLSKPRDVETVQHVICPRCVADVNSTRVERGLPEWPVFESYALDVQREQ